MKKLILASALMLFAAVCNAQYMKTLPVYDVVDGFPYPSKPDSSEWRGNGPDRMVGEYGYAYDHGWKGSATTMTLGIQTVYIDPESYQWAFVIRRPKIVWVAPMWTRCDARDVPLDWVPRDRLPFEYRDLVGKVFETGHIKTSKSRFHL